MRYAKNGYRTLIKKGTARQFDMMPISWMLLLAFAKVGFTDGLKRVTEVEFQPIASATQRLIEALDYLGSPLSEDDLSAIREALVSDDHRQAVIDIQKSLDLYCLVGVHINPESRVKVTEEASCK